LKIFKIKKNKLIKFIHGRVSLFLEPLAGLPLTFSDFSVVSSSFLESVIFLFLLPSSVVGFFFVLTKSSSDEELMFFTGDSGEESNSEG
jgi:predicted permease